MWVFFISNYLYVHTLPENYLTSALKIEMHIFAMHAGRISSRKFQSQCQLRIWQQFVCFLFFFWFLFSELSDLSFSILMGWFWRFKCNCNHCLRLTKPLTKPELLNMTESLFEASSLKQQQELVEYLKKKKKITSCHHLTRKKTVPRVCNWTQMCKR